MKNEIRVLIITYYWPPSGGSGVQRWVYFSKYLNRLGVKPYILTVDPNKATYPSLDESLNDEVKEITVYRTNSFEPLQFYSKITTGNKKDGVPYGEVETSKKSPFKKFSAYIRGNFILPDARKYWNKYAFPEAKKIIQKENIDLIITTGPPHSTHLIGLKLKSKLTIPWLADFRDPWTEIFYNKDLFRTKFAIKKDKSLETKVLNSADKVLAISTKTADLLLNKMNDSSKIHCILNGFDQELFDKIEKSENSHFTISYVGYLGKHHQYSVLTEALRKIASQNNSKINLHLAGNINNSILKEWDGIDGIEIIYEGIVSHKRALEIIKSANLLFISIPISSYSKGNIPGKLLEYLATGNPIILAGEKDSDAAKILSEFSNTAVVENNEVEELSSFINKVINKEIKPKSNNPAVNKYSRLSTTQELLEVINSIV